MRQRAEVDVEDACGEEAWAYPALVLKWSERYYASERDLADAMLADLDERDHAAPVGREPSAAQDPGRSGHGVGTGPGPWARTGTRGSNAPSVAVDVAVALAFGPGNDPKESLSPGATTVYAGGLERR